MANPNNVTTGRNTGETGAASRGGGQQGGTGSAQHGTTGQATAGRAQQGGPSRGQGGQSGGAMQDVVERGSEMWQGAQRIASDAMSQVRDYMPNVNYQDLTSSVTSVVNRHPVPAFLVALGVGVLLGSMMGGGGHAARRSRHNDVGL